MTWGDVLCAALDACRAGGTDRPVEPDKLPDMVREILAVTGDAKSTYTREPKS